MVDPMALEDGLRLLRSSARHLTSSGFLCKGLSTSAAGIFVFRASVDSLSFISRTGIRPRTTSPSKTAQRASDNRGALRAPHQSFPAWGIERGRLLTHMSLAPNGDGSALGSYGEAQCRNLLL